MSAAPKIIDFQKIEGPVYTGRGRGEELRNDFHLDQLDTEDAPIVVEIPEGTYTISSSFFLGLFGPSVVRSGSKEAFYSHYNFKTPAFLKDVIDGYVVRALVSRNLFT